MEMIAKSKPSPIVVRAKVITQNYICFVYLPKSCFWILSKSLPSGSVTKTFQTFYVTIALGRFETPLHMQTGATVAILRVSSIGLREGQDSKELVEFEVLQPELSFWQALSRCVAYAAFSNLD